MRSLSIINDSVSFVCDPVVLTEVVAEETNYGITPGLEDGLEATLTDGVISNVEVNTLWNTLYIYNTNTYICTYIYFVYMSNDFFAK